MWSRCNGKSGAHDNQCDLWGRKWTKCPVGVNHTAVSSACNWFNVSLVYSCTSFQCSCHKMATSHISISSGFLGDYITEVLLICFWSCLLEAARMECREWRGWCGVFTGGSALSCSIFVYSCTRQECYAKLHTCHESHSEAAAVLHDRSPPYMY